jgi:hypothetical protein
MFQYISFYLYHYKLDIEMLASYYKLRSQVDSIDNELERIILFPKKHLMIGS